jgi:hypothetical protein
MWTHDENFVEIYFSVEPPKVAQNLKNGPELSSIYWRCHARAHGCCVARPSRPPEAYRKHASTPQARSSLCAKRARCSSR